jgi:hypothetical protein
LTNNFKYDTIIYTVKDIQNILSLGRTKAYELMRSDGFPSVKLNNRLYVSKENFEKWFNKQTNKTYSY